MPFRIARGPLLLTLLLAAAHPARSLAQQAAPAETEEKARGHFRLGRAYYDNGDFAQAALEFEAAYRISQRAALLYNIYLAYRDANDQRNAAEALRKYLALEKNIENRGQLEARLTALDRALASAPPSPPPAAGPVAAPSPAGLQPPAAEGEPESMSSAEAPPSELAAPAGALEAEPEAGPSQLVPYVLMGTGGAMVVGSVVTGMLALGKYGEWDDARRACQKAGNCTALPTERVNQLNDTRSGGETLALVTDILMFGGLAVAGTGVVLYFVNRGQSSERPSATSASLGCAPGGCVGSVTTRF